MIMENNNRRPTVWIIDDDRSIREFVKLFLHKDGYNIVEFVSADDAIDELKKVNFSSNNENRPDVIVTDNNTGSEKKGTDVIVTAKKMNIPTIMLSTSVSPETRKIVEENESVFIDKGDARDKLAQAVVTAINRNASNQHGPRV